LSSIQEKLDSFPTCPGVYLMKDRVGKVIYIWKAKDLRNRVRGYFRGGDGRSQIDFLMRRVGDVETLVTTNEKEALILENNLIKQYKPRYNIRLKDDKSYLSIKVTISHPWPRILATRKIVKDGNRYFGPYSSAFAARETIDIIEKHFLLRTCTDHNFRNRARPCLQYQIRRCLGPCVLPVDEREYEEQLKQVILFIEGKSRELLDELKAKMEQKAEALQFEAAAKIRDQIQAVEKTLEKQRMVSHWGADQDIFGLYREGGFIEVQVLFVRQGKLTGNQAYSFEDLVFSDEDMMESLLTQFYQGERFIPDEILLPLELDDKDVREDYLTERKDKRVVLLNPRRGDRELQERLRLKHYPQRIECYDISNISGKQAVGSQVTFFDGEPDKKRYRHYRIRSPQAVRGGDDFAMIYEVLQRRFRRGVEEGDFPDLVVVDGGKGQLGMALAAMQDLGVEDMDVIALAKMRVQSSPRSPDIQRTEERVFRPGQANPVTLSRNSNALFLLQRVRDEAHRFAITHHKKLRSKQSLHSVLDQVPGIGGVRKRALLRALGSLKRIEEATLEDLLKVPSINEKTAREILDTLKSVSKGD
jgi:excinuclease ABC subunit C